MAATTSALTGADIGQRREELSDQGGRVAERAVLDIWAGLTVRSDH